ncbi:hypothetical protein BC941DRAFT_216049 [Chlamydoabsidia padenii]|nr:hypothetical protein BC941DRAFT_216049 [Chlamydoabsidia padenii]
MELKKLLSRSLSFNDSTMAQQPNELCHQHLVPEITLEVPTQHNTTSDRRPSLLNRVFRSNSITNAMLPHSTEEDPMYPTQYLTPPDLNNNNSYTGSPLSCPTTMNADEQQQEQRRPSRFSFLSIRRPSLSRHNSLFSFLSRPPSYKRFTTPEQEAQLVHDLATLQRLESYYHSPENTNDGLLHPFSWLDPSMSRRHLVLGCIRSQFTGIFMAAWLILFVFIGAISVFVPNLPPLAKLLWLPLALYCIAVVVLFVIRQHRLAEITRMEHQLAYSQQQRQRARRLPEDYYFVIEQRPQRDRPVMTLIPPPPTYPMVQITPPSTS